MMGTAPDGSLWAMMRRRYEAYKDVVVRPFFRDHFTRLDRQIVLVDALAAFNAGPEALKDLEGALSGILDCFNIGRSTFVSSLFRPRIDKILFAATKADHLHHTSHDRLEAILKRMVERAASRAEYAGASVDVVALAAVRATREAMVQQGREKLPSILGTPEEGEMSGDEVFDGETEVATFPGDLPARLDDLFSGDGTFRGLSNTAANQTDFRFLRFRPPLLVREGGEEPGAAPYPSRPCASVSDRRQAAMSDKPHHRKPAAFKLDDPRVILMDAEDDPSRPARGKVHITPEADPALLPVPIDEPVVPARKGFGWAGVFWTALAGLVVLGLGLGISNLVEDLFNRSTSLGYIGLVFAILAVVALVVIIAREAFSLARLETIEKLHARANAVLLSDDRKESDAIVRDPCSRSPMTIRGWPAPAPRWKNMAETSSTAPT